MGFVFLVWFGLCVLFCVLFFFFKYDLLFMAAVKWIHSI